MKFELTVGFLMAGVAYGQVSYDMDDTPGAGAGDMGMPAPAPDMGAFAAANADASAGVDSNGLASASANADALAQVNGENGFASADANANAFASNEQKGDGWSSSSSAQASASASAYASSSTSGSNSASSSSSSSYTTDEKSFVTDYVKQTLKCGKCEKQLKHINDRVQTYMKICGPQCPKSRINEFVRIATNKESQHKVEEKKEEYVALLPVIGMSEIRAIKPLKKLVAIRVKETPKTTESVEKTSEVTDFKKFVDDLTVFYLKKNPSQINNTAEVKYFVQHEAEKRAENCKPCKEWMKTHFETEVEKKYHCYQKNFTKVRHNKYIRHFRKLDLSKIEAIKVKSEKDLRRYTRRMIQYCLSHQPEGLSKKNLKKTCRAKVLDKVLVKAKSSRIEMSGEAFKTFFRAEFRAEMHKYSYYRRESRVSRYQEDITAFEQMRRMDVSNIQKFEVKTKEDFRSYVRQLIQYRLSHESQYLSQNTTTTSGSKESVVSDVKKFVQEKYQEKFSQSSSFKVSENEFSAQFSQEFSQEYSRFESIQKTLTTEKSRTVKEAEDDKSRSPK